MSAEGLKWDGVGGNFAHQQIVELKKIQVTERKESTWS